jgi:hypothetical protein
MRRLFIIITLMLVAVPITIAFGSDDPPPPSDPATELAILESAIIGSLGAERDSLLAVVSPDIQVTNLDISADGMWGVGWLAPVDPESGQPVGIEPAVVVTNRERGTWQVWHPASDGWIEMVQSVPDEILSLEHKTALGDMYAARRIAAPSAAIGGYLLPWEAGDTHFLTQSACHDEYLSSGNAHYAFDFSTYGQLWNIHAAQGGVVWLWKEDVSTCYEYTCSDEQSLGNYIVIRDDSTDPVTYQLYLHLAFDSIPDNLKSQGTPVNQGQFIGIVDNTGQSWGHHLHFQVQVPIYGESHYWGQSIDITFEDVAINGGRPRVQNDWCNDQTYCDWAGDVCADFQSAYVSQNEIPTNSNPPDGDILGPTAQSTLVSGTINLGGIASDPDDDVFSAQFIAEYNEQWHTIGPSFDTPSFSYAWDWCAEEVPDGPISLALRLEDEHGNQNLNFPGLRPIIKAVDCPLAPKCSPADEQVAIFSSSNYQGQCQVLDIGDYPDSSAFAPIGNDEIASILVGRAVNTTLFSLENYSGRVETLEGDDPSLDDNRIGSNEVSAIKVYLKNKVPATPNQRWPEFGAHFSESDSTMLVWQDTGGGLEFRATLDGPSGINTTAWGSGIAWSIGSLPAGIYTWRVQARNDFGESAWTNWLAFIVDPDPTPTPLGTTAPYSDTLEISPTGWITTGLWHLTDTTAHSETHSYWYSQPVTGTYATGEHNYGTLTSRPITLPVSTNPYFLSFWYQTATENRFTHWDQRRVQISIDDGSFFDLDQLGAEVAGGWLPAQYDLSPYYSPDAAHAVRVRFYFSTVDEINNNPAGWHIDDIQIDSQVTPNCSDSNEQNGSAALATSLQFDTPITAEICPAGDQDYYIFTGSAGDQIVVDVDAKNTGSDLDSILYLLAEDGTSILAQHDDEVVGIRQDPHLGFRLPRDGNYYLLLQAWDHPMGTGTYSVTLSSDPFNPSVNSLDPDSDSFLPSGTFDVDVPATDSHSGMSHVIFWQYSEGWNELGQDWDGADGWASALDTSSLPEGQAIALYAQGFDWAGNWSGAAAWNIVPDFSHPNTSGDSIPDPADSTAIFIDWTGTDNLAGIRYFHVRHRKNFESWDLDQFEAATTSTWYVGEAGNNYTFRVRAIDNAGNLEAYLDGVEFTTTIPEITTLCANPDAWDTNAIANDNSSASATPLTSDWQTHNFCNPETADRLNDEDWFSLAVINCKQLTISAETLHPSAAVDIHLYAADGVTLLAEKTASEFGAISELEWLATYTGTAFAKLKHPDGRVAGDVVNYRVALKNFVLYFPLILR